MFWAVLWLVTGTVAIHTGRGALLAVCNAAAEGTDHVLDLFSLKCFVNGLLFGGFSVCELTDLVVS